MYLLEDYLRSHMIRKCISTRIEMCVTYNGYFDSPIIKITPMERV